MKDFNTWNSIKTHIDNSHTSKFYKERDIWWCSLGLNIGTEQDGKDLYYQRPILVIRGFGKNTCLIVPLTTSEKENIFRCDIGTVHGRNAKVILSQIRVIDTKRLVNKIGVLDKSRFRIIKERLSTLIVDSLS